MALNSLLCADVPLSNYSLTHWRYTVSQQTFACLQTFGCGIICQSKYMACE